MAIRAIGDCRCCRGSWRCCSRRRQRRRLGRTRCCCCRCRWRNRGCRRRLILPGHPSRRGRHRRRCRWRCCRCRWRCRSCRSRRRRCRRAGARAGVGAVVIPVGDGVPVVADVDGAVEVVAGRRRRTRPRQPQRWCRRPRRSCRCRPRRWRGAVAVSDRQAIFPACLVAAALPSWTSDMPSNEMARFSPDGSAAGRAPLRRAIDRRQPVRRRVGRSHRGVGPRGPDA